MEGSIEEVLTEAWANFRDAVETADSLLAEARSASTSYDRFQFEGLDILCRAEKSHIAAHYISDACKFRYEWEPPADFNMYMCVSQKCGDSCQSRLAVQRAIRNKEVKRCWKSSETLDSSTCNATHELLHEKWLAAALQDVVLGRNLRCKLLERFSVALSYHTRASTEPAFWNLIPDFSSYAAAALMHEAPPNFQGALRGIYARNLHVFYKGATERCREVFNDNLCSLEDEESEDIQCDYSASGNRHYQTASAMLAVAPSMEHMQNIAQALRQLGLETISSAAYEHVVCQMTQEFLSRRAKGRLDKPVLASATSFLDAVILPFLSLLLGPDMEGKQAILSRWKEQLQLLVYRLVGALRIAEIFEIVTDYPDSSAAVDDLQECMKTCSVQKSLVKIYCHACSTRLHIPGAKTTDIIEFYVHSIKILRQLDATGILLEAVSGPTRQYLQTRKDAIRCIVSAMTDDSAVAGESLFDELHKPAEEDEDDEEKETDAFAMQQFNTWVPEPVNADLKRTVQAQRMNDIISMLVHIYGSKDLFISEYRGMLAERLLAKSDFDTDTEIRTLEHLKKRFGESNLHSCEVMMKDLADSKRLFNTIKVMPDTVRSPVRGIRLGSQHTVGPASATIISAHFWPPLQAEALKLDSQVEGYLDEYAAKFWVAKQPRKLVWMKHLGTVDLTLTVHGIPKDFSVSPFEASILLTFQHKTAWLEEQLAEELGTTIDVLHRKIGFWVKHGVLLESRTLQGKNLYTRTQQLNTGDAGDGSVPIAMEEDDGESALLSQEEQLKQDMATYEQYIMGMLSTFESGLPLDRIHNMLKMFVPDQAYDKTMDQLSDFLSQLVNEEKLLAMGSVYTKQTA